MAMTIDIRLVPGPVRAVPRVGVPFAPVPPAAPPRCPASRPLPPPPDIRLPVMTVGGARPDRTGNVDLAPFLAGFVSHVGDSSIHHTAAEIGQIAAGKVAEVVDGAPAALDTLREIADVIGTEAGSGAAGILKRVADLESGKADKAEMSVTPVAGSLDKTTIQLKSGTSATVLTAHQDISGKVDKNETTVVAGLGATATGDGAVAVGPVRANGQGAGASAEGNTSIALGYWSRATAFGAVQVGYGVNSTQNSFQFRTANLFVESDGAVRLGTGFPAATTAAPGSMSAADKAKLNGIAAGATAVTVDSALSQTSENPVQNKAVAAALAQKQDALGFTPEDAANKKALPDTRPSSTDDYPTSQSVFDTIAATRNRLFVAADFLGKWVQSALRWTDVSGNVHLLTMITHNHLTGLRTAGNDAYATLYFVDADAWYAASGSSQRENVAYAEVMVYMGGASGTAARVDVTMYNGGSPREYARGLSSYLGYSRTIVTNVSEDPADPHGSVELVPLAISSQVSDALVLKANAADLPYAIVSKAPVNGTVTLSDRAVNLVPQYGTDVSSLALPPAVPGKSRDFYLKMTIPRPQDVSFSPSTGVAYTGLGDPSKAYSAGTYVLRFTETSENEFCVTDMLKPIPDVTGKADKAVPSAAGNLASLNAQGNLADSGVKPSDFAAKADLPYAMVTPGEWEFSADGFSDVQKLDFVWYDHGDEDYRWDLFYNGTNTYISYSVDPNTMEITGTLPTEVDSNQTAFTATRASLPGHLLDRAGNRVEVSGDTTLTLPAAAAVPGYLRDFLVRLEISGSTVPTITFAAPTGETITYETDGDEFPVPDEAGTWLYSFTETAAHKFAVSLKKVNVVTQGGS